MHTLTQKKKYKYIRKAQRYGNLYNLYKIHFHVFFVNSKLMQLKRIFIWVEKPQANIRSNSVWREFFIYFKRWLEKKIRYSCLLSLCRQLQQLDSNKTIWGWWEIQCLMSRQHRSPMTSYAGTIASLVLKNATLLKCREILFISDFSF